MLRTLLILTALLAVDKSLAQSPVKVIRLPEGAIQPQLVTAGKAVHLIYFQKANSDSKQGHLQHRIYDTASGELTSPTKVTETAFTHNDQIGKADVVVDRTGRVHVAWFQAIPLGYYYTRSIDDGKSFATPTSLVTQNLTGVEVEPTLAAHGQTISVAWHAGDLMAEEKRQVFQVVSADGGETFSEENPISSEDIGVCGCCAMSSEYDQAGRFNFAFRSAIEGSGRHLQVVSEDTLHTLGEWQVTYCPVTSSDMVDGWLVFETKGRLYQWHPQERGVRPLTTEPPAQRQKHPSLAINSKGDRLIVWGEANGYFPGGKLSAALFQKTGQAALELPVGDIPEYSVASATALPDDSFLLIY